MPSTGLSQANVVARRLCEALSHWLSQCSTLGARTGRALRDCFTQSGCIPFDVPLARSLRSRKSSGQCHWSSLSQLWLAPRRLHAKGKASALPFGPLPEGYSPKDHQKLCPWIVRTQFSSARPVRAPKAQQWLCTRQSHRTNRALVEWAAKGQSRSSLPFTLPDALLSHPLACEIPALPNPFPP